LHKLHILPSQWVALEEEEKAFIIACIDIRVESEKKEAKRIAKEAEGQ
jgi:hypothetical protein